MIIQVTETRPEVIREMAGDPQFVSNEPYATEPNGHLFSVGEEAELHGLTNFPEFNGTRVTITNIREDGPYGKAYYIKGGLAKYINWTYEYRLNKVG